MGDALIREKGTGLGRGGGTDSIISSSLTAICYNINGTIGLYKELMSAAKRAWGVHKLLFI